MNKLNMSLVAGLVALSANAWAETSPKLPLIEYQKQAAEIEVNAVKAATPEYEARPAAKATSYPHAVESPKANLIRSQIKAADEAKLAEEAAKPAHEARPAATVKQPS